MSSLIEETQTNKLLKDLNPQQQEAVTHKKGPLLVLAGAGSGKTRVLTYRAVYMIMEKLANPEEILLLTFTNKAADEMKKRISSLVSETPGFAGTFHSFCARILRIDGPAIGIDRNFLIYDSRDTKDAIKSIIDELDIDDSTNPGYAAAVISDAKSQMISPLEYGEIAKGDKQEAIFKIYVNYQRYLKEANALDFDDLLLKAVELFDSSKDILNKWQYRLPYVFVDEWQDTNKIQYKLTRQIVGENRNITAVGDASQCVTPDTLIQTSKGVVRIDKIKQGCDVLAASGRGQKGYFKVNRVFKRKYKGNLIKIITKKDKVIRTTPNHILFAKLTPTDDLYHVYLMYRKDKGYRIGLAKGKRAGNKRRGRLSTVGISTRGNQEAADKMWILKTCNDKAEANYWEYFYAFKYGIPTLVFDTAGRKMVFNQDMINSLFSEINTVKRVEKLMKELDIDPRYPHHRPKGISGRKSDDRQIIHLKFFDDKRISQKNPWSMHRIALNTTDKKLKQIVKQSGFHTRPGRRDTWSTEICRLSYKEIVTIAKKLSKEAGEIDISYEAFILEGASKFYYHPASHLHPHMIIPILENGNLNEDEIKSVASEYYEGYVYDLEINNVHNYIANNIVVHNSIYGWRGADYRNINYLMRDYNDIKVINLERNYRSTQNILDAANSIIKKNASHPVLSLWTDKDKGEKIKLYRAQNEHDEASFIVNTIDEMITKGFEFHDFAVLYRTNAQSRVIEEAMLHQGIPYTLVGGVKFYQRKEIKDVLGYLRLLINPKDKVSERRVISLGKQRFNKFTEHREKIKDIHKHTTLQLLDGVIKITNYLDKYKRDTEENMTRKENIKELRSVATEFPDLETFLENVALVEAEQDDSGKLVLERDFLGKVTLMTLHAAKGLEFPIVFIIGMEEGLFPHSRSLYDIGELEEERRLAYVGITRSKEHLFITYAGRRLYFGQRTSNPPSRFIIDIPEELLENADRSMLGGFPDNKDSSINF